MTQFSDADIDAVARVIRLARIEQGTWSYQSYARDAMTALTELGWGKKPTRSEARSIIDKKITFGTESTRERVTAALIEAGLAVEDPEPEWEPTEEAFDALFRMWKGGAGTIIDYIPAVLKHLHDKPHLIGMGEEE